LQGTDGKLVDAVVGGRFECSDVRAQASAVYAGLGIGPRPIGEVQRAVKAGTLERVLPDWKLEPLAVRVLQPPRYTETPKARAIRRLLPLLTKAVERMM
jgi:DNA-binding transcriptional LysR family regulator